MQHRTLLASVPMLMLLLASCSRDPKSLVEQGNKFYNKGRYKEASIMYRRALIKDKKFGEGYYRLGLTDLKLSAYSDAAAMLQRAADLEPNNTDATVKLADLYLLGATQQTAQNRDQYTNEAQDLAQKLLKTDSKSFDGHRILGQIALIKRDYPTAVKELSVANDVKPLQPELCVAYFRALVANKQPGDAERLAKDVIDKNKNYSPMYDLLYLEYRSQDRPDAGEQLLKLKTVNNPDNASYQIQLATHYFLVKNREGMESVISNLNDEKRFPEGHLLAGNFFFYRLKEYDRARQQYEAAMKAFPKDKSTYQKRLVELYATQGKNDDANQLLASILKDNPKDNDAVAMRAALMLSTGNRDQINVAANDLQSLVTKTPQNHLLRFNLARALIAKNDLEGARLQLEEAIKIRPDFVVAHELLARLYLANHDAAKALKAADDLIAIDPNNLQGHLVRSSALMNLQQNDKAHAELDYITKNYPQNADARYQVGYLAWQDKDYKKAEQVFGDLYKANPKDPRGLMGVTETLVSQNKINDAIQEMQRASAAEPNRRDLKVAVANLEVRAQRYDDAIAIFKGLVDKEPKSADLLFKLAETYRRKGDLNNAIDYFRRSSQAAPNNPEPLLQLGLLMDGTGKRDQAEPIYEQILRIQPDHPVALNNLAYIKAEEGTDLESALTMAQRARQKAPNSDNIEDTLGWIYIKKNLTEDAVRIFQDLVKKEPDNPSFHYHYGMALFQKGDRISAKKELNAALACKTPPSSDDKQKIQQLLQKL